MARQVIPRLNGDEYQHLYSWWRILCLLRNWDHVSRIRVEDPDAGSIDDVTVHYDLDSNKPDECAHYFYQVKYHQNQEHHYSAAKLMECTENHRSLLRKFFDTWKSLQATHAGHQVRLYLVSNWSWSQETDKVGSCLDNYEGRLSEKFFRAGPRSNIGQARRQWREHLGTSPEVFEAFARTLYFQLGEGTFRQLEERVGERMEHVGLKHDHAALAAASKIVRDWIRADQGDINVDILKRVLKEWDLYLPPSGEQCVTVHLNTIADGAFDLVKPDFILDWRKYFEGRPDRKGHQLKNPANWDKKLLPELRSVLTDVRNTTNCRLVRARGLARLSAWFAFGYTFSEVAGYTIEVQQQEELWRTDAPPSQDFHVVARTPADGEPITGTGVAVACGVSVTGLLDDDVRAHLRSDSCEPIAALLLLGPERDLGRACLRSAGDAVALARGVKRILRPFVKRWRAERLLLYYFGPLSGACFIGHQLNAVCREVLIMEDQQPGYALSFSLS